MKSSDNVTPMSESLDILLDKLKSLDDLNQKLVNDLFKT